LAGRLDRQNRDPGGHEPVEGTQEMR
jgi:hypothetical protein